MPPQHAALLAAVATTYLTQRLSPAGAGSCGVPGIHVSATVETESALSTVVNEYSTDGIAGYTTYRVAVNLLSPAQNIYTIFGDSRPMHIPAALQQQAPFGVDVGGSNPQFFAVRPECEFDSWLTVGPTDGSNNGALSTIGIDFTTWDETQALSIDNGAVFWMDPDRGPTAGDDRGGGGDVVLAQLTMVTGTASPMRFDAQGNSAAKHDWEEHCIEVMVGGPNSGAGSHSASGIPMPVQDGTCDEGTNAGSCPAGTDTADCRGQDCLTVDAAIINTSCGSQATVSEHGSIPDQCTPACATVFKSWWERCSPAQEVQLADHQMNGGLSKLYAACTSQNDGH